MVPLPDRGIAKKYGECTVEDLQLRLERFHRPQRNAAHRHIREDNWAVRTIEAHQVACLNDLAADILLAELPPAGVTP